MEDRRLVLVDAADREVGEAGLRECHRAPGRRHRAFTAVIFDAVGRVVLARRAPGKPLWPGFWDATVASHPLRGQRYANAGRRRLAEELGRTCRLFACGRFEYRAPFRDVGVEHEVCATLAGRLAPDTDLAPDPAEISEVRRLPVDDWLHEIASRPRRFCPWMLLAALCMREDAGPLPPALRAAVAPLRTPAAGAVLADAVRLVLAPGAWNLLDARLLTA